MSDLLWYTFLVVSTVLPICCMARGLARVRSFCYRIKMPKMGAIARDE